MAIGLSRQFCPGEDACTDWERMVREELAAYYRDALKDFDKAESQFRALIDLDPGPRTRPSTTPVKNLLRLYRSYLKGESQGRWRLTRIDLYRFAHGYCRGDRTGLLQLTAAARRLRRARRAQRARSRRARARTLKGTA